MSHPYVGMWVTADGRIRHELLANGRYDEARNGRAHAYQRTFGDCRNKNSYLGGEALILNDSDAGGTMLHNRTPGALA
jgi:hypothetical protein